MPHISFEPLSYRNLEFVRELRNQNKEWFMDSKEVLEEEHRQFFRETTQSGDINLVIRDNTTTERVGFISIYNITPDGHANIGRMMVKDSHQHQGYMLAALIKAFDLCHYFDIRQLVLEVKASNVPARSLYTKCGFVTEGFTRDTIIMRKRFV
jgi:RimJ/RimL family protein N-acetyltransferase